MRQTLLTSHLGAWLIPGSLAGLSLIAAVVGCTGPAGFDRDAIHATFRQDAAMGAEQNGAVSATEKPTTPIPFRLALYFVQRGFPPHHAILNAEWSSADKDTLGKWLAPLQDERLLTESFLLVDSTIQGNDVRKIRRAAARYGADLLVTFDGAAAVDRYNNYKAPLLYWTILGAYFANGTHSDALCLVRGSIWDVKSGTLLASEEAEGRAQTVGPAALVDDRVAIKQAKQKALEELGRYIVEQLKRVRGKS